MGEDKLTRAERIRLESFSQACSSIMITGVGGERPSLGNIFQQAEQIERWLRAAKEDA